MAADGAVAAEEQDGVGLIGSCRHADAPLVFERLAILKRLEVVQGTSQTEDGGGAHVREGSRIREKLEDSCASAVPEGKLGNY